MKVQALSEMIRSLQNVQGKNQTGDDARNSRQGQDQGSGHRKKEDPSSDQASQDEDFARLLQLKQQIDAEIERFARDEVAKSSGLRASREGEGLGLKVLLKDISGSIIRRMSGDEFLRIRASAAPAGPHGRGKLLDRKL